MKERIVCIEWEDACFHSGYYDKKRPEDFEPILTKTVGHWIKRTPEGVIVSQERFYNDKLKREDDRHIVTIPRKMIRKITELK